MAATVVSARQKNILSLLLYYYDYYCVYIVLYNRVYVCGVW